MQRRRAALFTLILFIGLVGACVLWLRAQQRQYALNRQLIAALVHEDDKQALDLVNKGADPNTRYIPTPTPSLLELVKRLFHRMPPPLNDSPTALMMVCGAVWNGEGAEAYPDRKNGSDDPRLTQAMFMHGANVITPEEDGRTPLIDAVDSNAALALVRLLIEHGANVNAQDKGGSTPLMAAATLNRSDTVHLLIEHGASVKAQDKHGETALYFAVLNHSNRHILRELLAYGADPNLADTEGITPISLARMQQRPDIVALLRQAGARK